MIKVLEIEHIQMPTNEGGHTQNIAQMVEAGLPWDIILGITVKAALATEASHPGINGSSLEKTLKEMSLMMAKLSEDPDQRRERRAAELRRIDEERTEAIWRDAMNGNGAF